MNKDKNKQYEWYQKMVGQFTPNSPFAMGLIRSFWVGGVICVFGQALTDIGRTWLVMPKDEAGTFASITLIFIGGLLTALGVYDLIGKYAGAGSIVPITGFSNSIVSCAMEFRREGLVTGVGARMFQIAGPVLVYGIGSSVLVGIITYFLGV